MTSYVVDYCRTCGRPGYSGTGVVKDPNRSWWNFWSNIRCPECKGTGAHIAPKLRKAGKKASDFVNAEKTRRVPIGIYGYPRIVTILNNAYEILDLGYPSEVRPEVKIQTYKKHLKNILGATQDTLQFVLETEELLKKKNENTK